MKLVEFIEFLSRCSYAKYAADEDANEKIKMILDELFPTYGLVRIEAEIEEEENSESDPDY